MCETWPVKKTIAIYSLAVAGGAFILQWLRYQYVARFFSTEIYVAVVALGFASLGVWVGLRLAAPSGEKTRAVNQRALRALGISPREHEVLTLLADGNSTKEIAESLFVSANTIKTHLANLYAKLDVSRRTQAIRKARSLGLLQ